MLLCNDVTLQLGNRTLFKNVQLQLLAGNRYAVVGANGAGKSTFLKLLAGEEPTSQGVIEKAKSSRLGLLRQDHFRYKDQRVIEVVIEGKAHLAQALREKQTILDQSDISEKECYRLAELEEIILGADGYAAEAQAEKILKGLGIPRTAHNGALSGLSGGYKLRVLLAQALFEQPDILLLDEPTNHLDIVSTQWLEDFLSEEYRGLLIFVSHDRQFINNVATHVLDIDYEAITLYPGNYDKFLPKKDEALAQKQHELTHKQQKLAAMQEYVDRFGASATRAKQAQSRLKMMERIELTDIADSSRRQPHFAFKQQRPSGKQVLQVKKLTKAFGSKTLFTQLDFNLQRGTKCAVIGPNGIGKSTLLKILMEQATADAGQYQWADTATIGYFAQDFQDLLHPELSLLQWLGEQAPEANETLLRKTLGQMLFSGDTVNKKIKVLSGGECARLIFAKLILAQPNVLILDEPTNHLDLEAIEGLLSGLQHYPGTVLFVSHNRYFLQQLAASLLVITPNKVDLYPGTYQEYVAKMGNDYLLSIYAKALS